MSLYGTYTRTMTEPDNLNVPIIGGSVNSSATTARKLAVWVLEILSEAIGTCLIFIAFAFLQFRHEEPPLGNDLSLYKLFGISIVVLIEFAMTGYLATTLISRFALRGKVQRLYPYACAGLYLLHSTIFFVAAGNPLLRVEDLDPVPRRNSGVSVHMGRKSTGCSLGQGQQCLARCSLKTGFR
jgi:hypothetical protein